MLACQTTDTLRVMGLALRRGARTRVLLANLTSERLRVPVSDDVSVTLEGRYNFADEVEMGDDFDQNHIDVSGIAATVGVRLRF